MFDMDPRLMIATAIPLLLSLSIHEYAHARMALAFGDPTAKLMGRCTLNPLVHLHPIGTLCLLVVGFGWAKPVPVNYANLSPPRRARILVSIAGPASNFAVAVVIGLLLKLSLYIPAVPAFFDTAQGTFLVDVIFWTMFVNIVLCVLNMLPLFPLDGHHIMRELLPIDLQVPFMKFQVKFGQIILMGIIFVPMFLTSPDSEGPRGVIGFLGFHVFDWLANIIFA
jgi:Zn-dependent protease